MQKYMLMVPRRHSCCVGGLISGICDWVCVCVSWSVWCVCTRSKTKTASAINTKFGTHTVYGSSSACTDWRSKGQGHVVTKNVTVIWLLMAAAAVCCCCWRGTARHL